MAKLNLTPGEKLHLLRMNMRGPLTTSENVAERCEIFSRSGKFGRILQEMGIGPAETIIVTDQRHYRVAADSVPEDLYELQKQYSPEVIIGLGRVGVES